MTDKLTVPNPFPTSPSTYRFTCPDCKQVVVITRNGWTTCPCGRRWELQIVAVAGQPYKAGPGEVK